MDSENIEAALVGNNLFAFFPGLTADEISDVQELVTYADLTSSVKFDKTELWSSWMFDYTQRLVINGFKRTSFITPDSRVLGRPDEWTDALFQIVGTYGSRNLVNMVKRCFSAAGVNQSVRLFFDQSSVAGKGRFLQLVPCEKTPKGDIVVLLCGINLSFNGDAVHNGGKRVILYVKGGRYVFDRTAYGKRRGAVSLYLDNRMDSLLTRVLI